MPAAEAIAQHQRQARLAIPAQPTANLFPQSATVRTGTMVQAVDLINKWLQLSNKFFIAFWIAN